MKKQARRARYFIEDNFASVEFWIGLAVWLGMGLLTGWSVYNVLCRITP